jgi:hypothetical protein
MSAVAHRSASGEERPQARRNRTNMIGNRRFMAAGNLERITVCVGVLVHPYTEKPPPFITAGALG